MLCLDGASNSSRNLCVLERMFDALLAFGTSEPAGNREAVHPTARFGAAVKNIPLLAGSRFALANRTIYHRHQP